VTLETLSSRWNLSSNDQQGSASRRLSGTHETTTALTPDITGATSYRPTRYGVGTLSPLNLVQVLDARRCEHNSRIMNTPSNYPSRSQSRTEMLPPPPPIRERGDSLPSNSPSIQIPTVPGSHIRSSPQKSIRTYDSKLISREMDRLGMITPMSSTTHVHSLSHSAIPSLPHAITPATSTAGLSLVPSLAHSHSSGASIMSSSSSSTPPASDAPWSALHVYVLPLFNGEPLRLAVEDLNSLVKKHLQSVVARAPSRAIATLESDIKEMLATGMITLNSKLSGTEDNKLLARVVDLWSFFWDQILPYIEGVSPTFFSFSIC
jgi:hypothetical protein